MSKFSFQIGSVVVGLLFALSLWPSAPAFADPPPWAPAHGWREKHHHGHGHGHGRGHDEDDDDDREAPPPPPAAVVLPYGLAQQTCHRDLVGAALGGVTGGVVGSHIGKGQGRAVATVGGVLAGIFVGGAIGRAMDQVDQACAGQVLEHVPDNRTVVWQGANQQGYWVTPTRSYDAGNGRYCREYISHAVIGGRTQEVHGTACREDDGTWQIVN